MAEEPIAESFVAVDVRTCILLAVVEMDGAEVLEAYDVLEIVETELVAHLVAEVVAGGEGVAGVDADTYAALVVDALNDAGDVLKLPTEVGTLSSCVLYNGGDAFGLAEGQVHLAGNLV